MRRRNLATVLGLLATVVGSTVASGATGAEATAERAARIEQVRAAEIAFVKSVMDDKPELFAAFEHSTDGTLGLSRGPWVIRTEYKDGRKIELQGLYNSVWQRSADGTWKVIFDAGCSPCPVCG